MHLTIVGQYTLVYQCKHKPRALELIDVTLKFYISRNHFNHLILFELNI